MYNEAGKWECQTESDCFDCPYPDCIQGKHYLKKTVKTKRVKSKKKAAKLEITAVNVKTNETLVISGIGKAEDILHSQSITIYKYIKNGGLLRGVYRLTARPLKVDRVVHGVWVTVTDQETNETTKFKSKTDMAKRLGITLMRINWFLKKRPDANALLDNRYRIEVGEKHSYREE